MQINKQKSNKQFTVSVGFSIGVIMLIPIVSTLIFVYSTLSTSFKNTLVEYSLSLVQSMAIQGVDVVEKELENNLMEVSLIAKGIDVEKDIESQRDFFKKYQDKMDFLRMTVFDKNGNIELFTEKTESKGGGK